MYVYTRLCLDRKKVLLAACTAKLLANTPVHSHQLPPWTLCDWPQTSDKYISVLKSIIFNVIFSYHVQCNQRFGTTNFHQARDDHSSLRGIWPKSSACFGHVFVECSHECSHKRRFL